VRLLERIIRVNFLGLTFLTRLVVPSMIERRSGHVCNVASMAGLMPVPHNAVYSATKHAVVGLTRSLRLELADHGVEVSVVCPGFVRGGMFLQWGRMPPAAAGVVTPEEVARATVRTVRKNLGEVNVTKGLGRIGDWFQAAMPEISGRMMGMTGVIDFLREQARLNASSGRGMSS
jgi:short-subunit dehydrogenase